MGAPLVTHVYQRPGLTETADVVRTMQGTAFRVLGCRLAHTNIPCRSHSADLSPIFERRRKRYKRTLQQRSYADIPTSHDKLTL